MAGFYDYILPSTPRIMKPKMGQFFPSFFSLLLFWLQADKKVWLGVSFSSRHFLFIKYTSWKPCLIVTTCSKIIKKSAIWKSQIGYLKNLFKFLFVKSDSCVAWTEKCTIFPFLKNCFSYIYWSVFKGFLLDKSIVDV